MASECRKVLILFAQKVYLIHSKLLQNWMAKCWACTFVARRQAEGLVRNGFRMCFGQPICWSVEAEALAPAIAILTCTLQSWKWTSNFGLLRQVDVGLWTDQFWCGRCEQWYHDLRYLAVCLSRSHWERMQNGCLCLTHILRAPYFRWKPTLRKWVFGNLELQNLTWTCSWAENTCDPWSHAWPGTWWHLYFESLLHRKSQFRSFCKDHEALIFCVDSPPGKASL